MVPTRWPVIAEQHFRRDHDSITKIDADSPVSRLTDGWKVNWGNRKLITVFTQ
jgi:hypothetical protein